MKIVLVVLGKLKEQYWRDAEAEYKKRLSAFCKLEVVELKEEAFSEKDNLVKIKEKEAVKIIDLLNKHPRAKVVVLDEHGKQYSSENLSRWVTTQKDSGDDLVFVIGGPLGLAEQIQSLATNMISLSSLTFTHQMARIFLLEQLYRAFMISENRKYHY